MPTAQQIIESIPYRFRPEKASGYEAVFQFDISGEEQLQYTVSITGGKCELTKGLSGTPTCTITTKAQVYVELETGKANPQMALMTGKVKISNIAAMMQFAKCFRRFDEAVNYEARSNSQTSVTYNQRQPKAGPLAGVKIIDFTRLLPGPLATMFLADMGADVIKVEDPDSPDYIRDFEPRVNGMSLFYLSLNRSKRSLAVNYLSSEGKQVIYDLVKNADVLIEQFRPGVMKELGFGYEELKAVNPKLIYVSVTGYGQTSPRAMDAGHDLNYIAIAGALGITGTADGELTIPGFQLADIAGGSYMAMNAVTAALYQREKTGKGEWVDVAMTDAVVPFTALPFAYYQGTKQVPPTGGFELSGALANYNVYRCADSKYIALGSLEPKFWNGFCARAGKPEWAQQFLQTDKVDGLKQEVRQFFLTKSRNEWVAFFEGSDICLTPINSLADLENDPYLQSRNMLLQNEHASVGKYNTINQPLKFKEAIFDNNWPAPDLGFDSASVLRELNYSDETVRQLAGKGIIKLTA
jgi:alpha-methylacyl-CoA racemase